jgi:hypothetical protein
MQFFQWLASHAFSDGLACYVVSGGSFTYIGQHHFLCHPTGSFWIAG